VPAGGNQTGLSPSAKAASEQAGAGSGADLHGLYQQAAGTSGRLYQLSKALTSLQTAGATGPGTETTQAIASFLNTQVPFGLGKLLPGVNPEQIKSYDEATKYLTQYASSSAGAMGSDSKLATALSSNASTHISNLAAQDVVKATIGIEREKQVRAQAFAASGLPDDQFDRWAANWSASPAGDPRVYAFDLLSPDQRKTVLSGMSAGQKSAFLGQVWQASQSGTIDAGKLGLAGSSSTASSSTGSAPAAATLPPPVPGY